MLVTLSSLPVVARGASWSDRMPVAVSVLPDPQLAALHDDYRKAVETVVSEEGFTLNATKTRIMPRPTQWIAPFVAMIEKLIEYSIRNRFLVLILAGAAHAVHAERPGEFNLAVLDFLRSLKAS